MVVVRRRFIGTCFPLKTFQKSKKQADLNHQKWHHPNRIFIMYTLAIKDCQQRNYDQ